MGLLVLHVLSLVAVEGSSRAIIRHGERLSLDQSPEAAGTATEAPVAREVDAFGRCTIPMWNARDFACDEHLQVEAINMYEDSRGRLRKKMDDGQSCTIRCPDARWWQVPEFDEMTCTRGLFKHGEGAIVKKIECSTSNIFKSSVILGVCVVALGIVATWYLQRRKSPPAAAPSGTPAPPPIQIVDGQEPAAG
ncbi:Uncharacterized protein SCF082_LOCUS51202 [Durusdinium trenchii]|uniref:Uncharacterized protein n=1 Tax=Durusdinium trenchii TaxID=1381693 RepID=A0ABP0SCX6_9DINO